MSNPEIAQSSFCRSRHGVANTLREAFDKVGLHHRTHALNRTLSQTLTFVVS
jgi:hypothetical protein